MTGLRLFALLGTACFAVVGPNQALGSIPDADGTYTACLFKALGTLRLIDANIPRQRCLTALETQVTWNKTGPQGLQGLPGVAGQQGIAGPVGPQGVAGPSGAGTQVFITTSPGMCFSSGAADATATIAHLNLPAGTYSLFAKAWTQLPAGAVMNCSLATFIFMWDFVAVESEATAAMPLSLHAALQFNEPVTVNLNCTTRSPIVSCIGDVVLSATTVAGVTVQ